jgi:hypothetical protein
MVGFRGNIRISLFRRRFNAVTSNSKQMQLLVGRLGRV